jgi:hypothetical protein
MSTIGFPDTIFVSVKDRAPSLRFSGGSSCIYGINQRRVQCPWGDLVAALRLLQSVREQPPCLRSIEMAGFVSWVGFSERCSFSCPFSALSDRKQASLSASIWKFESLRGLCGR